LPFQRGDSATPELSCELAGEFPWFAASALYPIRGPASAALQQVRYYSARAPVASPANRYSSHNSPPRTYSGTLPVQRNEAAPNDERHSGGVALARDLRGHWPPPFFNFGGWSRRF